MALLAAWPLLLAATAQLDSGPALELAAKIDRAREAERRTREEWDAERARLEVLESALDAEHDRAARRLESIEQETKSLEAKVASLYGDAENSRWVTNAAATLAAHIEERRRSAEASSFLGLHEGTTNDLRGSGSNLGHAFDALAASERRARSITRRRLTGLRRDGSRQAAEVLVAGGVAAWWRSADGSAGTVRLDGERVHFDDAPSRSAADRIARAFDVHEGGIAADLLALPVPETRTSDMRSPRTVPSASGDPAAEPKATKP